MPAYLISEYASGRVIFSLKENSKAQLLELEPYIQAYKKISRVENQFVVRHPDGRETDTAGHPVAKDTSALLFEITVERKEHEVILSTDSSMNTPEARLALNQLKAYASTLELWTKSLFTFQRIIPKIQLNSAAKDSIQRAYDLENLEYNAQYKKNERKKAALRVLESLALVLVGTAMIALPFMLITGPVSILVAALVLAPVVALGTVGTLMGIRRLVLNLIDLAFPSGIYERLRYSQYNGHFGALCSASKQATSMDAQPGTTVIFHSQEVNEAAKAVQSLPLAAQPPMPVLTELSTIGPKKN